MKILKTAQECQEFYQSLDHGSSYGFIPTMGCLHAGHLSLIKEAQSKCKNTVVSIYVNPTQFNSKTDLDNYPDTLETDVAKLIKSGVTALFIPTYAEIYPDDFRYSVVSKGFKEPFAENSREGHFEGVLTIVMKLLNILKPSHIFMGEKDFQQLQFVKEMICAFFIDTELVACPTLREDSGLAMSSRNNRLSKTAKKNASDIFKQLQSDLNKDQITQNLKKKGINLEYLESGLGRKFIAAEVEGVRLIDNIAL